MPHFVVTANTGHLLVVRPQRRMIDRIDNLRMAMATRLLRHAAVVVVDQNLIGKITGRKRQTMKEPITGLAVVLVHGRVVRSVAVVAGSNGTMRRLQPGIVVPLHHVTIRTRRGVIGKIRSPFGIVKGVRADPGRRTDETPERGAAKTEREP